LINRFETGQILLADASARSSTRRETMTFTLIMMAVLLVLMAVGGTILILVGFQPTVVLSVIAAICGVEAFGYTFGIIVPMWHGKEEGQVVIAGWKKWVLGSYFSPFFDPHPDWAEEMERNPKYQNICYLGTTIWICLHCILLSGSALSLLVLLYRYFLRPLGQMLGWVFSFIGRVLRWTFGGAIRFLERPLFSWMPRWVALVCLLLMATYIHPESRDSMAHLLIAAVCLLAVVFFVSLFIFALFASDEAKEWWGKLPDWMVNPDTPQIEKAAFWVASTLVVLFLLSPLAFNYWATVKVLAGLGIALLLLTFIVTVVLGFGLMIDQDEIDIPAWVIAGVSYMGAMGGLYLWLKIQPEGAQVISNVVVGMTTGLVAVATVLFFFVVGRGVRYVLIALSKFIQARREARQRLLAASATAGIEWPVGNVGTGPRREKIVTVKKPKPPSRLAVAAGWALGAVEAVLTYLIAKPVVWCLRVPGSTILTWIVDTGSALESKGHDVKDKLCPLVEVDVK